MRLAKGARCFTGSIQPRMWPKIGRDQKAISGKIESGPRGGACPFHLRREMGMPWRNGRQQ
jgi:hypothetical protein